MIPAKTSEGLIGNEDAIYPCPKGQGIIAKTWGLIDKMEDLRKKVEKKYTLLFVLVIVLPTIALVALATFKIHNP